MKKIVTILMALFMSGCVTTNPDVVTIYKTNYSKEYKLEQKIKKIHEIAVELKQNPNTSISFYASEPCDTSNAWLPNKGVIRGITFFRAIRRERMLKIKCSQRHEVLRDQIKAAIGEYREGIRIIIEESTNNGL